MHTISRKAQKSPGVRRAAAVLAPGAACVLLIWLVVSPAGGIAGVRTGLSLCGEVVIPSLFPFLALSVFVIRTGLAQRFGRLLERPMRALFRLPGSAAVALALGIVGGYPVGGKACADLCRKKALSQPEAERLMAFCINSSPSFIIGAVGAGLLHSSAAGVLLYAAHLGASLLTGLLAARRYPRPARGGRSAAVTGTPVPQALVESVNGAMESMLAIAGFVIFFSGLSGLFFTGGGSGMAATLFKGLMEVTNGCAAAAAGGAAAMPLMAAMLSFSGLSVICQVMAVTAPAGLSVRRYLLARLPHMVFSVLLTMLLMRLFPMAVPAFAGNAPAVVAGHHTVQGSLALLVLCALMMLSRLSV